MNYVSLHGHSSFNLDLCMLFPKLCLKFHIQVEIELFKRAYLLLLEKQRKSLITVENGHIQTTSFLGCPIVHFMNKTGVVPLHRVLSYVPLVHHCAHSHCTIRKGRTTIRVEQEDTDVYRRFVVHNMNHAVKVYVVNVYSLKCPSGIPSADLKTSFSAI